MKNKVSTRNNLRLIHILASAALGAFLYSPWRTNSTFVSIMSFGIFPILTLSGLWMWQGYRIQRWFNAKEHKPEAIATKME